MSKLSVHLVTWNGAKYIPYLFESLRKQTFKDWELLIIENDSKDATAELIKKELENFAIPFRFVQNQKNIGFAPGHNQAIRMTGAHNTECFHAQHSVLCAASEYIQLLNQDMYLAPDYFEKIVAMMVARPQAGAGQGLLLRWDFSKESGIRNQELGIRGATDIIDTAGLCVFRNRRVVDWKTGEQTIIHDSLFMIPAIEIFGVSGALPIYRRKAVEQVMFENQMFDEDFFMYKEDVDLAFRLRAMGWKAYVDTSARAWHDRTAAGPRDLSDRSILKNRKTKSAFVNYHSYKNHLMILLKNEHRANLVKDWLWIFWYELKKFAFLALTDWKTLKGLGEIWRLWPRLMQKRKQIMNNYEPDPALREGQGVGAGSFGKVSAPPTKLQFPHTRPESFRDGVFGSNKIRPEEIRKWYV